MSSYKIFRTKVVDAGNSINLLETWRERELRNRSFDKLRYFVRKNWVGAKINRFSHAMDPDRGILTFISFVFSHEFSIYGIYALVRPKSGDILKGELSSVDNLKAKLFEALSKDEEGIPKWFITELKNIVNNAKGINDEIDFHAIWEKHRKEIIRNKVVMTIALFLDGMYLNHNGIKLVWDRYKLLGSSKKVDFLELLKNNFGFNKYTKCIPIEAISLEVDEDEVTYTIVHRVLLPNKFRIVSISYPGSQGGEAILPEPEKGKAQSRKYPDIIALPPKKIDKFDVLLNESKGMFRKNEIEGDLKKILKYKTDKSLKDALKHTLLIVQVINKNDNVHKILIGVSFGIKSNTSTTWKPDEVDFIFRIVDRNSWAIGIFNQALRDLIPIISGDTNLPKVYKIKSQKTDENQLKIF